MKFGTMLDLCRVYPPSKLGSSRVFGCRVTEARTCKKHLFTKVGGAGWGGRASSKVLTLVWAIHLPSLVAVRVLVQTLSRLVLLFFIPP